MKIYEKSQKSKFDNVAFATVTEGEKPNERTISLTEKETIEICYLLSMILPDQECKCDAVEYEWKLRDRIKESDGE